jgi:hypothetical protein
VKARLKALEVGGLTFQFEYGALAGIGHPAEKRQFMRQPEDKGTESHALNHSANNQSDPLFTIWCDGRRNRNRHSDVSINTISLTTSSG